MTERKERPVREDVVARRLFTVDGQQAECRFFRPREEDGSYFCSYEIDWPDGPRGRYIGGVDEVQALLLAMQQAHTDLLAARNMENRTVEWLDERSLGLPLAGTIRDWDPENGF
jgi:hypothetical protein